MSDVFIVDLFYFQKQKYYHFTALNQTFYSYAIIYQIHDIEYSVCIWHIQKQKYTPLVYSTMYPFLVF